MFINTTIKIFKTSNVFKSIISKSFSSIDYFMQEKGHLMLNAAGAAEIPQIKGWKQFFS